MTPEIAAKLNLTSYGGLNRKDNTECQRVKTIVLRKCYPFLYICIKVYYMYIRRLYKDPFDKYDKCAKFHVK